MAGASSSHCRTPRLGDPLRQITSNTVQFRSSGSPLPPMCPLHLAARNEACKSAAALDFPDSLKPKGESAKLVKLLSFSVGKVDTASLVKRDIKIIVYTSDFIVATDKFVAETLTERFVQATETARDELVEVVATSTEGLVEAVDTSTERLVEIVETSTEKLVEAVETSTERLIETVETSTERLVEAVETSTERLVETVETSTERLVEAVDTSTERLVHVAETATNAFTRTVLSLYALRSVFALLELYDDYHFYDGGEKVQVLISCLALFIVYVIARLVPYQVVWPLETGKQHRQQHRQQHLSRYFWQMIIPW